MKSSNQTNHLLTSKQNGSHFVWIQELAAQELVNHTQNLSVYEGEEQVLCGAISAQSASYYIRRARRDGQRDKVICRGRSLLKYIISPAKLVGYLLLAYSDI